MSVEDSVIYCDTEPKPVSNNNMGNNSIDSNSTDNNSMDNKYPGRSSHNFTLHSLL